MILSLSIASVGAINKLGFHIHHPTLAATAELNFGRVLPDG